MPKKRLTMRRIRELLRLKYGDSKLSDRAIAMQLGVARSTVQDYLARIAAARLSWPLPEELCDEALDRRLFGRPSTQTGLRRRVEPDWAKLARELKRPGVTLQILWEEYQGGQPGHYGYSRYVICSASSSCGSRRPCGSTMSRATSCSSTIPARRSTSSIRRPAR